MRRSRLSYVIPPLLLSAACGSFGARGLDGTVPAPSDAGIAGFSYDAGVAQGGQAGVKPAKPPNPPTSDEASSAGEGASDGLPPSHVDDGGASSGGSPDEVGDAGHDALSSPHGGGPAGGAGRSGAAAGGRSGGAGQGAGGRGAAGRAQAGASSNGGEGGHAGGSVGSGAGQAGTVAFAGASGTAGASGSPGVSHPILLSEYVEGSGTFKAVELRASSSTALEGCAVATYSNGAGRIYRYLLQGTLAAGKTLVLCSPTLAATLGDTCDQTVDFKFNGNDAVALECGGVPLDVIGQIGVDPGTAWIGSGVSTANQTLRRLCSVEVGHASSSEAFDPSLEWQAFPLDDFSDLGHSACD